MKKLGYISEVKKTGRKHRNELSNFKSLSQMHVNFITESLPAVVDKEPNVIVFNDKCELLSNFLVLLITY